MGASVGHTHSSLSCRCMSDTWAMKMIISAPSAIHHEVAISCCEGAGCDNNISDHKQHTQNGRPHHGCPECTATAGQSGHNISLQVYSVSRSVKVFMHCCCSISLLTTNLTCGLQFLTSLSLSDEDGNSWDQTAYSPPQTSLQLPEALPRLRHLHFGSCHDWDAMGVALWPLSLLAANSISEIKGECGASTGCAAGAMSQPPVASQFE